MDLVKDNSLIKDLNRTRDLQSSIVRRPIEKIEDPGALSTFGQSVFRAGPEAIGNVMMKLGLTNPKIMEEALYGTGEEGIKRRKDREHAQMAHPVADIVGSLLGFGPLGAATSAGIRSVPAISRAVKSASPSLMKRTGLHAAEGGAIGSLYSPSGKESEGAVLGSLIGGILGGPAVSLAKNIGKYKEQGRNVANIEELMAERNAAEEAHSEQEALIEAIKNKNLEEGTGSKTVQGINRNINNINKNINKRLNKIEDLQESANIPHEQTENLLNWPGGEELIPEAINQKNMGLKEIEHYLRSGVSKEMPLDVAAANEVRNSIRNAKKYIQKNYYEPVTEYTKKNYIELPRTIDLKSIEDQLKKISKNPNFRNSREFENLQQEIMDMTSDRDLISAHDFVNQWKETKQASSRARRKGFQEGGENQAYWQDQAAELKEIADRQLKILEDHLPSEYFDKLREADKLWKENIAPFYGNKIYEQVKKLGRIDVSDIPKELRGSGMGQEKMLELFLANPKLTRLALAHSHAKNPEALLIPNPHEHAFINRLPSLQKMLERSRSHNRALGIAKAQYEFLQEKRTNTEKQYSEIVKEQNQRKKDIKEQEKLKYEVRGLKDELGTFKDELVALNKRRYHLKNELEKGEITKKEFERLDASYKEAIKNKNSLIKKATMIATSGAAIFGVSKAIKQLMGS